MSIRFSWLKVGSGLALLAILAGVGTAYAASRSGGSATAKVSAASAFGVLDTTPALEEVPASVRRFVTYPSIAQTYAPNIDNVHVVTPAGSSSAWYVIPGDASLCFFTDHTGSCSTLAQAEAGGLVLWGVPAEEVAHGSSTAKTGADAVMGLAPDGASSVTLTTQSGAIPVPVSDNIYTATGSGISGVSGVAASAGSFSARP